MTQPSTDRMYLDLKGARERLCRAQTFMGVDRHRIEVQGCLDVIDRLGVFYAPQQWSKFDEPEMPPLDADEPGTSDNRPEEH